MSPVGRENGGEQGKGQGLLSFLLGLLGSRVNFAGSSQSRTHNLAPAEQAALDLLVTLVAHTPVRNGRLHMLPVLTCGVRPMENLTLDLSTPGVCYERCWGGLECNRQPP